jgi:hypothetical protein
MGVPRANQTQCQRPLRRTRELQACFLCSVPTRRRRERVARAQPGPCAACYPCLQWRLPRGPLALHRSLVSGRAQRAGRKQGKVGTRPPRSTARPQGAVREEVVTRGMDAVPNAGLREACRATPGVVSLDGGRLHGRLPGGYAGSAAHSPAELTGSAPTAHGVGEIKSISAQAGQIPKFTAGVAGASNGANASTAKSG